LSSTLLAKSVLQSEAANPVATAPMDSPAMIDRVEAFGTDRGGLHAGG